MSADAKKSSSLTKSSTRPADDSAVYYLSPSVSSTSDTSTSSSSDQPAGSSSELITYCSKYGATRNKSGKEEKESRFATIKIIDHLITALSLAIGTYIGVILRILLSHLSHWDGIQHFPSIWAQIIGTAVMGFAVGCKDHLLNSKVLYTAITTGLCGSLTTFSSWNSEASMVLLQLNETSLATLNQSHYGAGAIGCLTVLLLGLCMPIAALLFGKNIAHCLPLTKQYKCQNGIQSEMKAKLLMLIFTLTTYTIVTSSIIASCIITDNYHIMFSLLLGQFGTYIRWLLSKLDTYFQNGFPLGTLLANSIGSIILAGTVVSRAYLMLQETIINPLVYDVLSGIITGFCGSLTTVSSFAAQLVKIKFRVAFLYALISVGIAQVMFTLILGTYSWTKF